MTVLPGGIVDGEGRLLDSIYSTESLFMQGDANQDGQVNLADFIRIAGNFGQSNRTFNQVDFNYDGLVNLVARKWSWTVRRSGCTMRPVA